MQGGEGSGSSINDVGERMVREVGLFFSLVMANVLQGEGQDAAALEVSRTFVLQPQGNMLRVVHPPVVTNWGGVPREVQFRGGLLRLID